MYFPVGAAPDAAQYNGQAQGQPMAGGVQPGVYSQPVVGQPGMLGRMSKLLYKTNPSYKNNKQNKPTKLFFTVYFLLVKNV